jgi:hypothetical protein
MEAVSKKYNDKAEFLFIYCREAHPEGDPRVKTTTRDGKPIKQTTTLEERKAIAQTFCNDMKLMRRILVDEFGDDSVQRRYGGLPNPTVVIDVDGRMALKMAWTGGEALDGYLAKFLAGGGKLNLELAQGVPVRGPGGAVGRPGDLGPMIQRMLEGIELTEAEARTARAALQAKMEMRGRLSQQARTLDELARNPKTTEAALAQAIKDFEKAVADYQKAAGEQDRKISEAVSAKAKAQMLVNGVFETGLGFMGPGMRPAQPPTGRETPKRE